MDTNKMREEFIRAYRRLLVTEGLNVQERHFELRDGEFAHRQTAIAWWAWQASREAVVVELPSAIESPPYACYQSGWNDMRGEAVDAIEAKGLKVAP